MSPCRRVQCYIINLKQGKIESSERKLLLYLGYLRKYQRFVPQNSPFRAAGNLSISNKRETPANVCAESHKIIINRIAKCLLKSAAERSTMKLVIVANWKSNARAYFTDGFVLYFTENNLSFRQSPRFMSTETLKTSRQRKEAKGANI